MDTENKAGCGGKCCGLPLFWTHQHILRGQEGPEGRDLFLPSSAFINPVLSTLSTAGLSLLTAEDRPVPCALCLALPVHSGASFLI